MYAHGRYNWPVDYSTITSAYNESIQPRIELCSIHIRPIRAIKILSLITCFCNVSKFTVIIDNMCKVLCPLGMPISICDYACLNAPASKLSSYNVRRPPRVNTGLVIIASPALPVPKRGYFTPHVCCPLPEANTPVTELPLHLTV